MSSTTLEHDAKVARAIEYFNAHKPDVSIRKVGQMFGVPHQTLSNRLHKKTRSRATLGGQNKILTARQEAAIIQFARDQAHAGHPCSRTMIGNAVTLCCNLMDPPRPPPSITWVKNFMKSHPELKDLQKPTEQKQKGPLDEDILVQESKDHDVVQLQDSIVAENHHATGSMPPQIAPEKRMIEQ